MTAFNDTLPHVRYESAGDHTLQEAIFQKAAGTGPRPLLVALHTWSFDLNQSCEKYAIRCQKRNWHFVFPSFRGPNWRPEACGSDLVVADILSAVEYAKRTVEVDPERIYLCGGSGGGHAALLLAGRAPETWGAVSAWCPISDLADWHKECKNTRFPDYAKHIELSCGGDPQNDAAAAREAQRRSPRTWLSNAAKLTVDISTGIHDGHVGSVPVGHAIRAFNVLAAPGDRISEEDVAYMERTERIPDALKAESGDPAFGDHPVLLRRSSGRVRLTLFEGAHELLADPALEFLSHQKQGAEPDWRPGTSAGTNPQKDLTLGK